MVEQLELSELKEVFKAERVSPTVGFNFWLYNHCQKKIEANSALTVNVMDGEIVKYQFTKATKFNDNRAPNEPTLFE